MKNLERSFPELENELFNAYDILSNAGFKIRIEDGSMIVYSKAGSIQMDIEDGMVIVPDENMEAFLERQEELY